MAVILPGAGDYESALRMMGEANAIDAFAEGRERNIRMQGELQRQALQRQAAEQRQDEINRKQALESAGFTEEMLASALSGGGGATGGGGRRRASSTGPALDYEAASLQEALAADTAEAQAASTQRMRELDAAQMALAKQLPAQAALEGEVDAGAARQRLLSGPPSYTASRMEQAELERTPLEGVAPTEGDLSRQRLSNIASALSGPRGTRESGLSPEEIDRFARERGIRGDMLARGLAAPTQFASTTMPFQRSGDPRLLSAIDAFEAQKAASVARPKDISEADWRNLQRQREGYSKLPGGTPFKPGDEETSPKTRLYRKDELKAPREELIAAGAQAVTNTLGQEEYWLPEGAEFTLAKSGPVDDTAEGEGFLQGRLASANKRLSEQTTKTNTLRSAVRRLKKKSGDQLVNPWERFGKPATFMPSIRATSFAVQRAKDGDPSLISQMIGRQLYPSELRDLERLTSNYQDFAGGVRAKATEITKSRKTAAQEAAEADELKEVTRFATLSRDLLKGANKGASEEYLDLASDEIALAWKNDPVTGRDFLNKHIAKNKSERALFLKQEKARRDAENKGSTPGAGYYASFNSRQLEDKVVVWRNNVAKRRADEAKALASLDDVSSLNKHSIGKDGLFVASPGAPAFVVSRVEQANTALGSARESLREAERELSSFTKERSRRKGGGAKTTDDWVNKLLKENMNGRPMIEYISRHPNLRTLKKKLVEGGWPEKAVDLAFSRALPAESPPVQEAPQPTGKTDNASARGGGPASSPGDEVLRKIGEAEKNKNRSRPSGPRLIQRKGESREDFAERRKANFEAEGTNVYALKRSAKKFAEDLVDGGPEGMSDADKSAVASAYLKAISKFGFNDPSRDATTTGPIDAAVKKVGARVSRATRMPYDRNWLSLDELGELRDWSKKSTS